jgi:hypothetical protein
MACVCLQPGCKWQTGEPEEFVSQCLASWHVYEDHPDIWLALIGDRPPQDPDPRIPAVRMMISGN